MGFPDGSDGKESAYNAGNLSSIPGLGRFLGEGHGNPLQYSCLENPHGQRSLSGYSAWGCKQSERNSDDLGRFLDFPGDPDDKKSACNVGDLGWRPRFNPWVGKIP